MDGHRLTFYSSIFDFILLILITGDYLELALHIGYSSHLVSPRSRMFRAILQCRGHKGRVSHHSFSHD